MAPPQKKQKKSSSTSLQPIDSNIKQWLMDPIAVRRWNAMKDFTIHEGSFINLNAFILYDVEEQLVKARIKSLLTFDKNNVEINHIMIKLFYANLNLQKFKPENAVNCLWSVVCGHHIFISKERMAMVLGSPNSGREFSSDFCTVHTRDRISHQFIEDHKISTKAINLRPTARVIHHTLIHSLLPRVGNFDAVYKENFKALYAIYGDIEINWINMIFDEILLVNDRKRPHIFYNEYVMRLLINCGVPSCVSKISKPKCIDKATRKRMKLPDPCINIIPFDQYQHQGPSETAPSTTPKPKPEEVKLLEPSSSTKDSLAQIARNQFLLEARLKRTDTKLDRLDTKLDKRFSKLKSFFGTIWEAISCVSTSSSTQIQDPGKRPMPPTFTWSSSEEGASSGTNTGRGRGSHETEEEEDDDDNEEDVQDEGDKEGGGRIVIHSESTESDSPSH